MAKAARPRPRAGAPAGAGRTWCGDCSRTPRCRSRTWRAPYGLGGELLALLRGAGAWLLAGSRLRLLGPPGNESALPDLVSLSRTVE